MSNEKKAIFNELIESLNLDKKLIQINEEEREKIISNIEKDIEDYRISNIKKIKESQEEVSSVILTS